jgi:hypothetical protein
MCRVLCALEWHTMYKELWQENVALCLLLLSVLYVWLSQLHWVPLSWLSKHIWEGIQCLINYYLYTPLQFSIWMIKLHVFRVGLPTINLLLDYSVQMVFTCIKLNVVLKTCLKVWNVSKYLTFIYDIDMYGYISHVTIGVIF